MTEPLVSIIIPTRNSEKTLPLCLRSIEKQTYKNIEVIVVDNYSKDKTVEIAKSYGARVYFKGPERSAQKNFGALKAQGDYVYFIDADFVLHARVVEEAVSLAKEGYDAVVILNISDPRPSLVAKIRFYERLSYYGSEIYEAARFIKKDLFLKVGGFDIRLYANEDYELHQRLLRAGAKIAKTKNSFEIHIGEPSSIKEFIIKNLYYASNISTYFRKNPNIRHMTPLRPTFFRKSFIGHLGRKWLPGLFLVILFKVLQATVIGLGILIKSNVLPYENIQKLRRVI